mgnify:CR=1 FL=1
MGKKTDTWSDMWIPEDVKCSQSSDNAYPIEVNGEIVEFFDKSVAGIFVPPTEGSYCIIQDARVELFDSSNSSA